MPLDVTERYKKCRAVIDGAAQPQLKGLDVTDRYNKARANIEKSLSSGQLNNPAQINPNVLGGMDILNAQSGKARAPAAVEAAAGASLKRQGLDEQYGGWLDKQYISNADVFDNYIRERDARQNAEKNRLGVSATQIKNLASGNAAETAAAQRVKNATGLSDEDLDAVYKRVKLGHGEAANYYSGRVLKGAANSAIGAGQFLTSTAYKALSVPASLIDATVSAVTGKNATQLEKTMKDAAASVYDKNSPQERLKSWFDDKVEGPVKNKYFSKGQRIAGDLAENVGAMLPAIAAGGAAGLAGATNTGVKAANYLAFGSGAAGNATKEALDAGADMDTAYAYGISSGMLEVLTEEMFAGIAGMPGGAVTEALGKVMKKLEKNGTVRLLTDIFGEGVEEVVSEWLTPYLKRATYDKNAALASWQDIMKSFGSGVLLSALMQGAGGALTGQLGSGTPEGMTEAPALMEDRSGRVDERAVDDVLTAPQPERRALPPLRVQGNPELRPLPPLIRAREGRTGSGLSSDVLTVKNTAAWPFELRDAVNALGKKLKTRIVVDNSIEGGKANGYYDDYYETIHIAADAENPVLQVALHEATHRMRTLSAEAYAAFRDYAVGMAGENAVANKLLEAQNRAARMLSRSTMTEEKAKDEIAAELAERFMTDEEAVTAFIRTNRTAAQRFFDALRSTIQTIKEALGGERTLAQAERLWKRAFEKAEASSRAEALSRGEVSSQADSRENEVYLGILFDKWAKGEITNEELDRAFSELYDVSDIAANENAAEAGGGVMFNFKDDDLPREYINYSDTAAYANAVEQAMQKLQASNTYVTLRPEEIGVQENATDWNNRKRARQYIKSIITKVMGDSVYFRIGDGTLEAYFTSAARDHYMAYPTAEKAAAAEKFRELVQNAVYAFSAEHDIHSEEGKRVEAKLWDYFVSSVKVGNTTTPVIFSVRSIEDDYRSQIYAVNIKNEEAATSRGDASRENPQSRLPSYGGFTTSNGDKISQKEGDVNREYSYKSDYEDYLNALEQDEEGTKSNFASLEENVPPEREEADGFDEVYEYLMDADLEQYDRDHKNKLNALAESEAPEETAPPTITRKDLDDYSKLIEDVASPISQQREAEDYVSARADKSTEPMRKKVWDSWRKFQRLMTDSGETVSKLGKMTGDKYLYDYYDLARGASSMGVYAIDSAQTDISGKKAGKSLNEIFTPIRAKGEKYYLAFQLYMYHKHNVARMSLANPTKLTNAENALAEFDSANPRIAGMTEDTLRAVATSGAGEDYLLAKDRLRLIREVNKARGMYNKPIFEGVSAAESRMRASELLGQHPEFAELEADVRKYINNLMQYRVDSGLLTQEQADRLGKVYPDYVPTYRVGEREKKAYRTDTVSVGRTVKKATGGTERLLPLHVALARQTMSVYREGTKNRFGQRLLENYDSAGGNRYIHAVDKYENDVDEVSFDTEDNPIPKIQNRIDILKDGKRYEMTVDDGLFDAMTALAPSKPAETIMVRAIRESNNLFKKLVTAYNPVFLIRNVLRDVQDAVLYSRDLKAFARNFLRAYNEIRKNGELWQQYKALGGVSSTIFDTLLGETKEHGKLYNKTLGRIEALNIAAEQAPRLTEFISVLEKGDGSYDSLMDAMHAAADVTVNFKRSGSLGKQLNANFVPFLNPGIQGFSKAIRRFTETKGAKEWMSLILRCAVLGLAPALVNDLLYGDDEEYKELRDSDKDVNYMFKLGGGLWLKIPKGRTLSLFGMAARRVKDIAEGEKVDWGEFFTTAANQIAPANPLENNILKAWIDADLFDNDSAGRTWYGTPIESQRLSKYAPGQRYDAKTDEISKFLGKTLNLSPKKINYILDQYTGVAGDIILPLLTPTAERDMFSKAFTVDAVASNKLSEQFYDISDEITFAKNKPGAGAKEEALSKWFNKYSSALSEVNGKIREIEADEDLSDKDKKELLHVEYGYRNAVERDAITKYEEYSAKLEELRGNVPEMEEDDVPDWLRNQANEQLYGAAYAITFLDKTSREKADELREAGMTDEGVMQRYNALMVLPSEAKKWDKAQALIGEIGSQKDADIAVLDLLSDTQQEAYKAAAKEGLREEALSALEFASTAEGEKDTDGDTIPGSRKYSIMSEIDGYDIPDEQKSRLLESLGYDGENKWNSDYDRKDYKSYYYLSDAAREDYWKYCDMLSATEYSEYISDMAELHDTKVNGKTTVKRKDKVTAYINGLNISSAAKDGLFQTVYTTGLESVPWRSASAGTSGKKLPPLTGPGTSGKKLPPLTGPGTTAKKLPPLKRREELSSSPVPSFAGYTTPIPEPTQEKPPSTYTEVFLRMQEEERARQPKTLYADYLRGMD